MWERTHKIAISKQLQTHFKAKDWKGVGTPFLRVPAPLHPVDMWVHALVLTNIFTDLSLIVNRKMKYWIAMNTIIIFTISI